jgi:hypothetical protein
MFYEVYGDGHGQTACKVWMRKVGIGTWEAKGKCGDPMYNVRTKKMKIKDIFAVNLV